MWPRTISLALNCKCVCVCVPVFVVKELKDPCEGGTEGVGVLYKMALLMLCAFLPFLLVFMGVM